MKPEEAMGMLLGKKIYEQAKNQINAQDAYDVVKAIVLDEVGVCGANREGGPMAFKPLRDEIKEIVKEIVKENIKQAVEEVIEESCIELLSTFAGVLKKDIKSMPELPAFFQEKKKDVSQASKNAITQNITKTRERPDQAPPFVPYANSVKPERVEGFANDNEQLSKFVELLERAVKQNYLPTGAKVTHKMDCGVCPAEHVCANRAEDKPKIVKAYINPCKLSELSEIIEKISEYFGNTSQQSKPQQKNSKFTI